jgi:hypothetical protein
MYRRGLNQARIAQLVGAPLSKVGYHLTIARRSDPGLTAEHEAYVPNVPARVSASGIRTMMELISFVDSGGRYPSFTAPTQGERKLAKWLQRRRRDAANGRLAEVYRDGLQALPGWESRTRSSVDESRWQARLAALVSYRANGEDWPRHKKTDSEEEHTLGVWLHAQRSKRARGELDQVRAAALDSVLPGWREGRRRGRKSPGH